MAKPIPILLRADDRERPARGVHQCKTADDRNDHLETQLRCARAVSTVEGDGLRVAFVCNRTVYDQFDGSTSGLIVMERKEKYEHMVLELQRKAVWSI